KQLHDKDDDERGKYKELLQLLKFWRENNSDIDELLLGFEHNFYVEIDDVNNLEEIDELLYKEFPNDEQYLFFYLATLERKKSFDKIDEICNDIKNVFDDEAIGVNISFIMIRNNIKISKGFEILYNLALDINNTNARKNYFTASLLLKDFFEQYEEVALGYWVAYSVNGKIEKKKITNAGGFNKEFIGKKKGESFSTKSSMSNNLNTIVIIEIYNDAMKLFRDISEEANNPINELGFESIQIPKDAEGMKKFLIEQFGVSGTQEKERVDNLLNDYYGYKVGFTEIVRGVFRENYINAYLHLTNFKGCKYTTLPIVFSQKITSSDEVKFILDFSTLLLFFSLRRDMDFKFKHKFKISYLIKKEIEDELLELKNSPESSMSIQITTEGITRYDIPENYKEKRTEFINSILVWIDENCEIDFVEEKLDLVPKLKQNEIGLDSNNMKLLVDYLHLSMRENHKLISSDTTLFLFKRNANLYSNIINPEKYLITFYPEKCNTDFYRYLLKNNYLGIDINLETLKNEFFDFITGRENYYLLVLENLQFYINHNPNIIII
ncbi:PIN domain-containing protein, partial [Flavobacterium collinsii]|uniref:PIN domain-containing protein n=1 Tax=Flavobacterium collinsii TaxID=1114861 RepID=UPI00156FC0BE